MKRGRKENKRWRQTLGILCSMSLLLSALPAMPLKAMEAEGQEILSEDGAGEKTGLSAGMEQTENPEEEIAGSMEQEGEDPGGGTEEPAQGENPKESTEEPVQGENPEEDTEKPAQGENLKESTEGSGQMESDTEESVESMVESESGTETEPGEDTECGNVWEDISELSDSAEDTGDSITASDMDSFYIDAEGNEFAYILDADGNATVTGITVSGRALVIPELIDGAYVTSVSGNNGCVVSNPETAIPSLYINCNSVGAKAFSGIVIGTLTIGEKVSFFAEASEGTDIIHYWNQFAGAVVEILRIDASNLSMEHTAAKGLSNEIHPPFEGAEVGKLEIGSDVEAIPEYLLYKAKMEMEELTVNTAAVGAYAFAGEGISIGTLTLGSGVSVFKEDYYSSLLSHYWNQFAGAAIGELHFYPENLSIEHNQEKGLSNAIYPPFEGAKVGTLKIGSDVAAIPEYLLYKAKMEMDELTVNAATVGAYAFAGGGISIGTLTLGGGVSVFKEDYYSSSTSHCWNQFAGATIGRLHFYSVNLSIEHTQAKGLSNAIHPPFEGAEVGTLEIGADVAAIPEYFLYKAKMGMEELTINAAIVGAYAFAGGDISIGILTLGSGVSAFKEDYYSSSNVHYWEQFTGTSVGTLRLYAAGIITEHVAEKGMNNSAYGPFHGAAVGMLEIGSDVEAIPEYFLYSAALSMEELEICVPEIGAYAFAGGGISFGTLIIGEECKVFHEGYYSTQYYHYWNQFMGSKVSHLIYAAKEAAVVNSAPYSTFNNNIYGPFQNAEIGELTIRENVRCIPDYFLHNARAAFDYLCLDIPVIGAMAFMGSGVSINRLVIGENVSHFASARFSSASSLYWNQFNGATLGTVDYNAKSAALDNLKGSASYFYNPFYKVKIDSLKFGNEVECIPDFCFHETILEQDELAIHAGTVGGSAFFSPNISIGILTVGKETGKFSSTQSKNSYYYRQFGNTCIGKLVFEAEEAETGMSCTAGPFEKAQIGEVAFGGEVAVIPNFLLYNAKITFENFAVSVPAIGCYSFSSESISFGSLIIKENVGRFLTNGKGYSNAFNNCNIGKLYYNAVDAQLGASGSGEYGPFYGAAVQDITIGESVRYMDRKFFRGNSFSDCRVCPVDVSEDFLSQQFLESCLPSAENLDIHHNSGFAAFFTAKAENTEWMCEDFYEISYGEKVYDDELGEYRIEVIKHCPVCGYTEGGIEDLDESYDVCFSIPVEVPLSFSQDTKSYLGSGTVYAYGQLGNAYDGVRISVDFDVGTYGMAEVGGKNIDISSFLSVGFQSGKEAAFTSVQVADNLNHFSNGNIDSLHTDKLEISVMGSAFLASGAGEYSIPIPLRIEIY